MGDNAIEVPLEELLRNIPANLRVTYPMQWGEDGRETGHSIVPIGSYCHRAADQIEQQAKEIDTLKNQITDMRDFCRTLTGSLWPQNETTEALKLYKKEKSYGR